MIGPNTAWVFQTAALIGVVLCTGCESAPKAVSVWPSQYPYQSTALVDKVWIKDGFDFNGYDTLYIAETQSEVHPADTGEKDLVDHAQSSLGRELQMCLRTNGVFGAVVTNEQVLNPATKMLVLEPSIVALRKGSRSVRFWVGFGAGMPAMVVRGHISESGSSEPVCLFEMTAAGEDTVGYVLGEFKNDKDLQTADIRGLAQDLAGFIEQVARHQTIHYKKQVEK